MMRAEKWEADTSTTVATETRVIALDVPQHLLLLDDGDIVSYGKVLLATGSEPLVPPELVAPIAEDKGARARVSTFRTFSDYLALDAALSDERTRSIVVVGGGPLGTELAYGLATRARALPHAPRVTLAVDDAHGPLAPHFPPYLREELTRMLKGAGVDVALSSRALNITRGNAEQGALAVNTRAASLAADHVVLAVGASPRVDIARESALEIAPDGGVLCSSELQCARDVFAAGDAASFWNPVTRKRERRTQRTHAELSGRLAAHNMLEREREDVRGAMATWSEQTEGRVGPLRYTSVGELDDALQTVAAWEVTDEELAAFAPSDQLRAQTALPQLTPALEARRGVVYYLRASRIVGVLLWNLSNTQSAEMALKLPREYNEENYEALRRVVPFEQEKEHE